MSIRPAAVPAMLALGLLVPPLTTEAQQAGKVLRIGYLTGASVEVAKSRLADFQQGLRASGYVEGGNIVTELRYAAGRLETLPELAAELVRLKVDVLVVNGDLAAQAAKKATNTIPIVMVTVADPVGIGLIASLARPGGNVTGLSDLHADLVTKRLQLLGEVVPSASRFAVLLNPANPSNVLQWKDLQAAAPALRVTLLSLEAKGPDDIDRAFATIGKERSGALFVMGDQLLATHRRRIFELAVKSRQPAIYTHRGWVDAGGPMSYGSNFPDQDRRLATYVDKVLKGAKPADLPVEQPMRFELVINLKTAKALGLTIPPSLLIRADEVIR